MLARSTAWRHGDGRTCTKNTSIRSTLPSRTIRLAGLMSRWARPASQSWRTMVSAWSITSSSIGASPISSAPSKNWVTNRYSRSGVSSTMPDGRGGGHADVAQEPGRVVLVLDEAAHRLERRLVLEPPVEDRPAELVPAVRPDVAHGVELPEQVRLGVAGDLQAQRRRAPRALEADRLDVEHREPELRLHRLAQRLAPPAGDVEVGGLAPPVGHRERLVRGEEAVGVDREGHGDAHPGGDVEQVEGGQVQLREREDARRGRRRPPCRRTRPRPAGTSEYTAATSDEGDDGERRVQQREAGPPADDRDVVGPGAGQAAVQGDPHQLEHQHACRRR